MNKNDLIVSLATMPDTDPRLDAVARALSGTPTAERPASLRLMTMGQSCEALNLSRATLWRLIRDGKINTVEIRRGSHRVPETELLRFVEGRA